MIAFDIDGVLVDFVQSVFVPASESALGRRIEVVSPSSYPFTEHFGISKEEESAIWESSALTECMESAPVIRHAMTMFVQAKEHVLITSRGTHDESGQSARIRDATRAWARKSLDIKDDRLLFVKAEDKAGCVDEVGAMLMFEDHPQTVTDVARLGIPVFMPVYRYNEHVRVDGVFRIEGWL